MIGVSPLLAILAGMTVVVMLAWGVQRAVNDAGCANALWRFGTGAACVVVVLWPDCRSQVRVTWIPRSLMYLILLDHAGVAGLGNNILKSRGDVFRICHRRAAAFIPVLAKRRAS